MASPNSQASTPAKINLAKWGIKFNGTDKRMNVQEFAFRVREMKRDFHSPDIEFITKFH